MVKLFILQFVSYFNITVDMRAVAHQQYLVAACTNVIAPAIAYLMIKSVQDSKSRWDMVGLGAGGALATVCGMWLTRVWG